MQHSALHSAAMNTITPKSVQQTYDLKIHIVRCDTKRIKVKINLAK